MANTDKNPQSGVQGTSYLYDYGTSPNTRTAVSQKVRILTPQYGDSAAMHQMGVLSSFNPSQSRTVEPVRGIGFGDQVAELVPSVTEPTTGDFERALLYLCNLWQSTGYAAGIDGPVRSLAHHKWPFDIEQQLVFSTLADNDLGQANTGHSGGTGSFDGGVKQVAYGQTTNDGTTSHNSANSGAAFFPEGNPNNAEVAAASSGNTNSRGHSAIITMYEACWFTAWSASFAKDAGMIMETGSVIVSDVHDFSSYYGEFLATGNDPTLGQLGSIRYGAGGAQGGEGMGGGGGVDGTGVFAGATFGAGGA